MEGIDRISECQARQLILILLPRSERKTAQIHERNKNKATQSYRRGQWKKEQFYRHLGHKTEHYNIQFT